MNQNYDKTKRIVRVFEMIEYLNKVIQGNSLKVLKTLPDGLVDCVVTSPPYWALRSYLPKDHANKKFELGQEKTFDEYILNLCNIFDEVKRVLKKDGTCWINLGDVYNGSGGQGNPHKQAKSFGHYRPHLVKDLPAKTLCNIPARFSSAMQDRGWILRNVIIWHKKNCMPSSAKDRFTVDFEYIFFFVKQGEYYFEQQFEPYQTASIERLARGVRDTNKWVFGPDGQTKHTMNQPRKNFKYFDKEEPSNGSGLALFRNAQRMPPIGGIKQTEGNDNPVYSGNKPEWAETGRNKRCVWSVVTKGFKGAHFATFPENLVKPMVLSGCPKNGLVLDPFMGSGTTAVVAKKLHR
ncbi:MAG: site-specific DNA-methyltransferase, partial [Planctomycetota bacterium]|nr:site-specific DNA-methyltransferase [Planctomycetota bacterium]